MSVCSQSDEALVTASSLADVYSIGVFADMTYWCDMTSALGIADVMLSASDGAAMASSERLLVLRLLFTLLQALPFCSEPAQAADTCKTITRLCRRWVQRAGSGGFAVAPSGSAPAPLEEEQSAQSMSSQFILSMSEFDLCVRIANLLPRLERSHSWLRTVCLSRATTSLAPPIKALMELLVAFKKTVVTLPAAAISKDVRDLISYGAATGRSAADTNYLMGREGPSIVR